MPEITKFLQQDRSDVTAFEDTLQSLADISQVSSVNEKS
jgi:flagellar biosynthesis/type III secretory pathway ATPase